jgi:hypothetical protein
VKWALLGGLVAVGAYFVFRPKGGTTVVAHPVTGQSVIATTTPTQAQIIASSPRAVLNPAPSCAGMPPPASCWYCPGDGSVAYLSDHDAMPESAAPEATMRCVSRTALGLRPHPMGD